MSGAPDRLIGLGRRLSKLRAMSPTELTHRLRYKAVVTLERRAHARGRLAPDNRLAAALRRDLQGAGWESRLLQSRAASASRFLPSIGQRGAMRTLFESRYAAERDDMRQRAADTRAHRFSFFGETFEYGHDIAWQDDPVTRKAWPAAFHADVPVHGGNKGYGDVKHVWELSRQQYLVDLGRAVFLDDDRESLASLQFLVRSWMAGNPYGTGVHWSCALEPAFRAFSWIWSYALTWHALEDDFHLEWLCGLYDAARFIERHLEHYSSPYNHLVGEAAALYMLGATFPEFADAERWRATARAVLEGRLAEQFYADGGSVEQSTFYHHASVGDYLLAALTARAIGEEFSPTIWQAIERGIDFSAALVLPDGRIPEIGGADDGKPIRMEHLTLWDFRPYQAMGAVLFRRGDLKAIAGRFHEDALWLLGTDGLAQFDALPAALPARTSVALPHSGYYVLRSDWSATADYVCFDCGEQAAGMRPDGIPNSMHGHADCLSIIVSLRGQRVLIDSGFHAYNCGGAWEAHFRETAAHNTARIDGRDQALHLGKMAWSNSYRAFPEGWHASGREAWTVGAHDGYDRAPEGVTHRRAVWLRDAGYVIVCDEFLGQGEHDIEVNFQFAPGHALAAEGDNSVRFGDVAALHWASPVAWTSTLADGGDTGPDAGWIAPSLGVKQAAPRLTLRCRTAAARTVLLTVLVPGGAIDQPWTVHRDEDGLVVTRGTAMTDRIGASLSSREPRDAASLVEITPASGDRSIVVVSAPRGRVGPTHRSTEQR
ncbi:hypothetical protein TBR22_A24370 [Luteitalea sp. TBR-22]|uniref:alginate lyase family protein n=1 Tax=Luteitalea sp. TBR-22 TaxID=2802971 RepID=UPI001AF2DCF5|nr:alginate lyase family protein [Luteitalea sp. TBR-22]BCS33210.1 hypothetical protein TBR22_A24370 [Luteitalea sp. TBR-22]